MKNKIIWFSTIGLMTLSLILVSCGPAETTTTPGPGIAVKTEEGEKTPVTPKAGTETPATEEPPQEEEIEMARDSLGRLVEKPKYGGWFRFVENQDPVSWDAPVLSARLNGAVQINYENLLTVSWLKGPSGTGEYMMRGGTMPTTDLLEGILIESWDIPDDSTIIWHVKKGIRWHDKPPNNGRELTAEDIAFSVNRKFTLKTSYHFRAYSKYLVSIEATDKYTVEMKVEPGWTGTMFEQASLNMQATYPKDLVELYGDMTDWRNANGTGPFMITDYVPGSGTTLERNPNYHMMDPMFPENRLPYPDGIQILIIPDASTRLAALRTGKIDHLGTNQWPIDWRDAESLMRTNPDLKFATLENRANASGFGMRIFDQPDSPLADVNVRRALHMAIDREAILEFYYGGYGETYFSPVPPRPENMPIFTSLEDAPSELQAIYEFNPDGAKQLLAEAGYPDGFTVTVTTYAGHVDWVSIVKDQWSKIGVELEFDLLEWTAFTTSQMRDTYKEMFTYGEGASGMMNVPRVPFGLMPGNRWNYAHIDDPKINELVDTANKAYWDLDAQREALRELYGYVQTQTLNIPIVLPQTFVFWQPWVKNYSGELNQAYTNSNDWVRNIWIDQALKSEMTR